MTVSCPLGLRSGTRTTAIAAKKTSTQRYLRPVVVLDLWMLELAITPCLSPPPPSEPDAILTINTLLDLQPTKACPVVIRRQDALEILAFEHPLAGLQLVKGTIERGESASQAALRELREESGLQASRVVADLGVWASGYESQVWAFHLCQVNDAPEAWVHRTADDAGHDFKFFWHPLLAQPDGQWHWVYRDALKFLAQLHF